MNYDVKSLLAQRELRDEGFYKGKLDGLWGEVSAQAMRAWISHENASKEPSPVGRDEFDTRSELNIATLCDAAQFAARKFMRAVLPQMAAYRQTVKITSGNRTYSDQDALYAQSRSKPGPLVTNARGGYSWHNFGVAWDITLFSLDGKIPIYESPHYHECALIGEQQGLDCGAFWSSMTDEPHYTLKTGLTLAQMRSRVNNGEPIV